MNIDFEKASLKHKNTIFEWLEKPHMKEFWDNSQEHKDDIIKFINNRIEPSNYFNGIFTYWIGSLNNEPYCFILTSEAIEIPGKEYPKIWADNISKTGTTYTIDFGIGNDKFIGKGLAAPTLIAFTKFFQSTVDTKADTFFIDPDENNPRAMHVYAKAEFNIVGDFIMSHGAFSGQKTYLMVKKCSLI